MNTTKSTTNNYDYTTDTEAGTETPTVKKLHQHTTTQAQGRLSSYSENSGKTSQHTTADAADNGGDRSY